MSTQGENSGQVRLAVLALLRRARLGGIPINRTKLAKLLYLTDLRLATLGEGASSGVEWQWHHFGPYSEALKDAESDLVESQLVRRSVTLTWSLSPNFGLEAIGDEHEPDVGKELGQALDYVLDRWGMKSAVELKELTYTTPPMRKAQEGGNRGVVLDLAPKPVTVNLDEVASFYATIPYPDYSSNLEVPLDDARLREVFDQFEDLRNDANRKFIG